MHNHNLIIVKADNKKDAISKARAFMDEQVKDGGTEKNSFADWYQIGGRFMWSNIVQKNIAQIAPKGFYVDGGIQLDYALKRQVDEDPEETECIDATDTTFWDKVGEMQDARYSEIGRSVVYQRQEQNESMREYYSKLVETVTEAKSWHPEMYLWNVTTNKPEAEYAVIAKDPAHWFLVNVDVHH